MISISEKKNCSGCHACQNICPTKCISMTEDDRGFLYPQIDQSRCINCGACERVCSVMRENDVLTESILEGYMAYSNNSEVRSQSSSGGIFTMIAEYIIESGGVVAGAAMSDDCRIAEHIIISTVDKLGKLRGSKYLQSSVGYVYSEVKKHLENNQIVFFTGTPCQIEGLFQYLGKDYEKLYTQDIICHGVPSPVIWKNYIEFQENIYHSSVTKVSFRDKTYGWKKFSLMMQFDNNKKYLRPVWKDPFMRGYLENVYLRPSCYDCKFKTINRRADFTLADFWGIQNEFPSVDDNKGITFVIVHTEKGKELIENLNKKMFLQKIDIDVALKYNPAAEKSVTCHPKADMFWEKYDGNNLKSTIKNCCRIPFSYRLSAYISTTKRLGMKMFKRD